MARLLSIFPRCAHRGYSTVTVPHPSPRIIFSGIQPTGIPHLGNYFGALAQWVKLQNASETSRAQCIFSVVGYHALTLPQEPAKLASDRLDTLASILAVGIDPQKSLLFHQDEIPAHTELAWILNCITPMGKLHRMTTWKSKLVVSRNANNEDEINQTHLNLGLYSYPVLQAADILLYKTTHVPVGEDQVQHLELARELAALFNRTFKKRIFPEPKCLTSPEKRVLSLRDPTQKMSKSAPDANSRILLTDPYSVIAQKLRRATTDSLPSITYDPLNRPGVSNLLSIYAACTDESVEDVARRFENKVHSDLKNELVEVLEGRLGPIRREFERIKGERAWLRGIAEEGRRRAQERSGKVMQEVRMAIGLSSHDG